MSATHPIFAIGALAAALLAAAVFAYFWPPPLSKRYASLDGLRGLLATLVVIHHAAIWRFYARTGEWALPPSRLYSHFGQSSVALFFMITAFLFGAKLLEGRARPVDWLRMYVSRVLRIVPLYFFFVGVLVVIAITASRLTLRESWLRLGLNIAHWLAFAIVDMPTLNRFEAPIIGGAAWSLAYEWWFYLALPALGLLAGLRRQPGWLVAASGGAAMLAGYWITTRGGWPIAAMFLGGCLAAVLIRQPRLRDIARHPASTILALAALGAAARTPATFDAASTVLLVAGFLPIACGNTLFGLLTIAPMRTLGAMSYSLYLLHGIGLYLAFSSLGAGAAARLTPVQHWLVVFVAVPLIVGMCRLTFLAIEAPAMAAVDGATARVRTLVHRAPVKAQATAGE